MKKIYIVNDLDIQIKIKWNVGILIIHYILKDIRTLLKVESYIPITTYMK